MRPLMLWRECIVAALLSIALVASSTAIPAQGQPGCTQTVSPHGTATVVCPGDQGASTPPGGNAAPLANKPPVDHGGPPIRMRFGMPIPTCSPGKGYSIEHQACISAQFIGGVIPCSEDDKTFDGRGYVPNCR